jgi:ribosome-binding protein aMBF1 (putative translation factor)
VGQRARKPGKARELSARNRPRKCYNGDQGCTQGVELSFGQELRELRRALDLTQAELANRVGCGVNAIRKLEAEERRPSRDLATRLASILGSRERSKPGS